jgi:hypothetical protein
MEREQIFRQKKIKQNTLNFDLYYRDTNSNTESSTLYITINKNSINYWLPRNCGYIEDMH